MKFLLKQIYFIALLFVLTLNNTAHCQIIQIEARKWNGSPIAGYAVPDALFATNTEDIFKKFKTTDANFYGKVYSMSLKRLYYPGGSIARLAHFYPGYVPYGDVYGYQINPWEDIIKEGNANGSEYDYMLNSDYGTCVADFATLCNNSSADVVLSYNILFGNICELNDLLHFFKTALTSPRKVDLIVLNTEVHLGADRDLVPNILTYYEKIKPFLDYLQNQTYYPGVKVGLDAAPDNVYQASVANQPFYDDWNDGISQIMTAYNTMNLSGTINWWWYPLDPLFNYPNCGPTCGAGCTPNPNLPDGTTNWPIYFNNGQLDALSFTNNTVSQIAGYYKLHNINTMNISQWGIKDWSPAPGNNNCLIGDGNYGQATFYNSMLQSTFMTKFLMKLIDYNFVNGEFFKSANYFNLGSHTQDRDPIYLHDNIGPLNTTDINTSVSLILYREILAKSRGLYWQMIQNPIGFAVDGNVEQFYFENAGIGYAILINENFSQIKLDSHAGIIIPPGNTILKTFASIKTLASPDGSLYSYDHSGPQTNHPSLLNFASSIVLSAPVLTGTYYTILPHSVTIIQLNP